MYTDCAAYSEFKSGKLLAGLVVAASMFSLKLGSAIGGALPGYILAGLGFVANEAQSEDVIQGIRVMFSLAPAAFFLLGGLAMLFYKIDRKQLNEIESAA